MKKERSILFLFAHPDDETFTSGIAISKYATETNTQLYLISATKGQAGKPGDPPLCLPQELAAFREQELKRAAHILGLTQVELWDYEDKHLSDVPMSELVASIHEAIERYQPDVLVTFAPHGISGHRDHQAISAAATQAVQTLPADSSVRKLYYATRASNGAAAGGKPVFSDPYETITTVIQGPAFAKQVAAALAEHKTQHLSVERVFPGAISGDTTYVPPQNHYILAWCNLSGYTADPREKEIDFFAGFPLKN